MVQNPFAPPATASVPAERNSSPLCTVMFWLSCILCLGMFSIAGNSAYQYWYYTWQAEIPLPLHILAATVCVACSGFGMLYAAMAWRQKRPRVGTLALGSSLLAFFVGPSVMALLV